MKTVDVTITLPKDDVLALNRAVNDAKKLAVRARWGWMRAFRAGMRVQRALDRVARRPA